MAPPNTCARRASACQQALGVDRIALYQLHAPDPRTPLSTSVRGARGAASEGLIDGIGLPTSPSVRSKERDASRNRGHSDRAQRLERCRDPERTSCAYCIAHTAATARLPSARRTAFAGADEESSGAAAHRRRITAFSPFDIAIAWLVDLSDVIVSSCLGVHACRNGDSRPRAHNRSSRTRRRPATAR
jgi:aryl-alcohol dehydrogenase-like predicted oxidoreductase